MSLFFITAPAHALDVTNNFDSGAGSLRAAVNTTPITFTGMGPGLITLNSDLPEMTINTTFANTSGSNMTIAADRGGAVRMLDLGAGRTIAGLGDWLTISGRGSGTVEGLYSDQNFTIGSNGHGGLDANIQVESTGVNTYAFGVRSKWNRLTIQNGVSGTVSARARDNAFGIYSRDTLTINGDLGGTITATTTTGEDAWGVMNASEFMNITGTVSANITATAQTHYAYGLRSQFNMTVGNGISGRIIAKTNTGSSAYAVASTSQGITINNGISGTLLATAQTDVACGMVAAHGITINNGFSGEITATAATGSTAVGMRSSMGAIAISGGMDGDITARAHTKYAYGIRADEDVTVTGGISGNIIAQAITEKEAYGILSDGATTLSGGVSGTISATAGTDFAHGIYGQNGVTLNGVVSGRISATAGGHTAIGLGSCGALNGGNASTPAVVGKTGQVTAQANGLALAVSARDGMNLDISGTLSGTDLSGGDAGFAIRGGITDGAGGWTEADARDTVLLRNGSTIQGKIDLSQGNDLLNFDGNVNTDNLISGGDGTDTLGLLGSGSASFDFDVNNFERLSKSGTGEWTLEKDLDLGTTGVAEINDGTFQLNKTLTSPNLTIGNGATLSGSGRVIGHLTNSGTISPGNSVGTTTINGDYTANSGSTLHVEVDEAGNHDKLVVSGTATLANGAGITVDVTNQLAERNLFSQPSLTQVIQAGKIIADPAAIKVTDNSALLNFFPLISGGGTSIDLEIKPEMTFKEAVTQNQQSGVQGVAQTLDEIGGRTTDAELIRFINHLYDLPTKSSVAIQVAQSAPVITTHTPALSSQLSKAMSDIVQARQQVPQGLNSGDPLSGNKNVWMKPFAFHTDQDDVDGVNGFSANAYGVGIGADKEYSQNRELGLALFYTQAESNTNNVQQESNIDAFSAFVYGSTQLLDKTTDLSFQLGGSFQFADTSRYISALGQTAKADYTANTLWGRVRLAKTLQINDRLHFEIGPALSYGMFYTPSYQESGAGGMNLSVESNDSHMLITSLEGNSIYSVQSDFELKANVSLGYDLINDRTSINSSFHGSGLVFRTQGVDKSPVVYSAGLGLTKRFEPCFSLDFMYDMNGRVTDYITHQISAKMTWVF